MSYPRFGHAIPSQRDGAKSRPSDCESLGHRPFCPKILKGVRDSQSPVFFAYFCQGTKAKSGLCTSCCGLKSDHSEAIKVRASQLHFKVASPVSTLSTCCSFLQRWQSSHFCLHCPLRFCTNRLMAQGSARSRALCIQGSSN